MLVLSVDNLAKKYRLLPSKVLATADTFDLYALDISTKWDKYQNALAEGKESVTKKYSQEELLEIMNRNKTI